MTADGDRKPSEPRRRRPERDEPVLPEVTRDETEAGWGDGPRERSDEWYRREKPPHHE